jgi:hypothetical protein
MHIYIRKKYVFNCFPETRELGVKSTRIRTKESDRASTFFLKISLGTFINSYTVGVVVQTKRCAKRSTVIVDGLVKVAKSKCIAGQIRQILSDNSEIWPRDYKTMFMLN